MMGFLTHTFLPAEVASLQYLAIQYRLFGHHFTARTRPSYKAFTRKHLLDPSFPQNEEAINQELKIRLKTWEYGGNIRPKHTLIRSHQQDFIDKIANNNLQVFRQNNNLIKQPIHISKDRFSCLNLAWQDDKYTIIDVGDYYILFTLRNDQPSHLCGTISSFISKPISESQSENQHHHQKHINFANLFKSRRSAGKTMENNFNVAPFKSSHVCTAGQENNFNVPKKRSLSSYCPQECASLLKVFDTNKSGRFGSVDKPLVVFNPISYSFPSPTSGSCLPNHFNASPFKTSARICNPCKPYYNFSTRRQTQTTPLNKKSNQNIRSCRPLTTRQIMAQDVLGDKIKPKLTKDSKILLGLIAGSFYFCYKALWEY